MIPPHLMLNLRQTRLRYASCNAVRAAPGLGLDVSPKGARMPDPLLRERDEELERVHEIRQPWMAREAA